MAEVSAPQAAEILNTSHPTIFRRVEDGSLPARREGVKREIWIDVEELRRFAKKWEYRFNEELATLYAK
jgi:excisionase family DNA binding protein